MSISWHKSQPVNIRTFLIWLKVLQLFKAKKRSHLLSVWLRNMLTLYYIKKNDSIFWLFTVQMTEVRQELTLSKGWINIVYKKKHLTVISRLSLNLRDKNFHSYNEWIPHWFMNYYEKIQFLMSTFKSMGILKITNWDKWLCYVWL